MRLRYQLVVAVLIIALMVTSFLAGRQFQSLADSLAAAGSGRLSLVGNALASLSPLGGDRPGPEDVSLRPLETFQEVLSHLRRNYVSPLRNESQLTYGAVRGMLAVLREAPYNDRYTRFLAPDEFRSFLRENEGHFGGIGAEIGVREIELPPSTSAESPPGLRCPVCGSDLGHPERFQVVIIAPLPDSPAERAGIQPGDHILRVDDLPTAGVPLGEVVRRIKGPPGTPVNLLIAREGLPEPLKIRIARAIIDVRSVDYQLLSDRIAYLRISTFNDTTPDLLKQALDKLRDDGMRGLLLDLRSNTGGGFEVCIDVASQFLGQGTIVYTQERGKPPVGRDAVGGASRFHLPLVVLINNGSASAAEILAGAIQDSELGTLVGVKTFGKGLVQTVLPLRDGSALALTTARYLTPEKRDIDRKGIEPDLVVEQPESTEYIPPLSEKDSQGAAALNLLRENLQRPRVAA
jgi:carboxyl-terminal processing protease